MKPQLSEKDLLTEVFQLIETWLNSENDPDKPVLKYRTPAELSEILKLKIDEKGVTRAELLSEIRNYLKYSVRTHHPAYLNQLFGGFNFPAFLGEIITSLTNTSMYTFEVAPVATLMENYLMDKMVSYTGWESGTGSLLTGGSNTNMVAMLLARNTRVTDAKMSGITGQKSLVVLVSEKSHFSMLKAANTIGIGQKAVLKVPVDAEGRMRGAAAESVLQQAMTGGAQPFMICSTAGSTETGSFDAMDEIAEVAEKYGLWHHVDGSWGGSVLLSPARRYMFKGLERADSFSWNPHKMMNIPLICSALLVKGKNVMRDEIQSYDSDYIYHATPDSAYDLGPASLQCGRRVDALKLWLAWKFYGDQGYAARIEKLFDLARYATEIVQSDPTLELMFPTQTLNVNFRYRAPEGVDPDRLNECIRYRMIHTGRAMVNYCFLTTGLSIRLILLNPDLTTEDVTRFFTHFSITAKEVLKEQFQCDVV